MVKFTARRKLDTGDEFSDFLIQPDEEFMIGWAYNGETSDFSKVHDRSSSVYEWTFMKVTSDGSPYWNVNFPSSGAPFGWSGASAAAMSSSAIALILALIHL